GTVERNEVRPLPYADADEYDNDGGRDETLDQVAVAPARRRHILVRLFIRVLVVDRIGCSVPALIRRVGVVERVRRLQHRLGETLVRMRLPPLPQSPPPRPRAPQSPFRGPPAPRGPGWGGPIPPGRRKRRPPAGTTASSSRSDSSARAAVPLTSSEGTPRTALSAVSNSERCSVPASRAAGAGGSGRSKIESECCGSGKEREGAVPGNHALRAVSCGEAGALSCGAGDGGLT